MPGLGQTAALLQIGVRADTARASQQLRRLDQTVTNSARNAQRMVGAQRSATTATKNYGNAAQRAATQQKQLERGTVPLTSRLKGVGKAAAGAAVAYVGLGAAKDAVETTEDLAKATLVLHRNLGLSAKAAGGLAAEAKVRGIDYTRLTMATKTYANAVEGAKDATSTQAEQFRKLGITTKELKSMNPDQLLLAIADGAQQLGNTTEKTKALGTIFGRAFGPLAPLFRNGAEGLRELIKANTEAGGNLGAKGGGLKGVEDLIKTQRELKRNTQGLKVEFTKTFGPPLIFIMGILIKYMEGLRKTWQGLGKAAKWVAGAVVDAFNWIVKANHDANKWISGVWDNFGPTLVAPFEWAWGKIKWFMQQIVNVVNFVLPGNPLSMPGSGGGGKAGKAPKGLQGPTGPKNPNLNKPVGVSGPTKQLGGFAGIVPGSGSGDKVGVQALVEPGEGLFVMNRNAMGALQTMNSAVPRFIGGGIPSALGSAADKLPGVRAVKGAVGLVKGGANWPDPSSLGWASGLGSFIISKAKDFIASHQPFTMGAHGITPEQAKRMGVTTGLQPGIAGILSAVLSRGFGLTVSSALRPGDTGSFHSSGRAVDLSGSPSAMYRAAGWIGKHLGPQLTEGIHNPNLSWDTGRRVSPSFWGPATWAAHTSHIHLAKQKGGLIRGRTSVFGPPLEAAGTTASGASSSVPGIAIYDRSTLGKMFRVTVGGHSANLRQTDIGPAPWTGRKIDITGAGVRALGMNPRNFPTDTFGKARLLSTLSGKHTGTTGKTAAGMKTPPALGAAMGFAGGDVDAMNTRIGAINDLRAARNLLALQGYQVGAAQNPILGLASPAYPSLAPMVPGAMESTSMSASNVSAGPGAKWGFHTHVYIDGKEVRHVTKKQLKRTARGGRRRLPSAGGG